MARNDAILLCMATHQRSRSFFHAKGIQNTEDQFIIGKFHWSALKTETIQSVRKRDEEIVFSTFQRPRWLEITEKVSFNIVSEASYVCILSRQKLFKNPKNCVNLASFWKPEVYSQTVIPDRSISIGKNWWKMPKLNNENATLMMIFKHCKHLEMGI